MKRLFAWTCSLLMLCASCQLCFAADVPTQEQREGVARIAGYMSTGNAVVTSGFAIGKAGSPVEYFVVSDVILADPNQVFVITDALVTANGNPGDLVKLSIVWSDSVSHIAIVKAEKPLSRYKPLRLASGEEMQKGDPVFCLGYAGTDQTYPSKAQDVVSQSNRIQEVGSTAYGPRSILLEQEINEFSLGGPVLSEQGNVIGAASFRIDNSAGVQEFVVYADTIIKAMEEQKIDGEIAGKSGFPWQIAAIAAGALVVGVLVFTALKKKRPGSQAVPYVQSALPGGSVKPVQGTPTVPMAPPPVMPPASYTPPPSVPSTAPIFPPVPVQAAAPAAPADMGQGIPQVTGTRGIYLNNSFPVRDRVKFGRDTRQCSIVYPKETPGISAYHCELVNIGGTLNLIDHGSSYGTFLMNGTRLSPNQPYPLQPGDSFYLASVENAFQVS